MKKATIKISEETGEVEGVDEFCDTLDLKKSKMHNGLARTHSLPGCKRNTISDQIGTNYIKYKVTQVADTEHLVL